MLNKRYLVVGMIFLLAMALLAGCSATGEKIGIVDMDKVVKESPKAQEFQNQLDQIGTEIQNEYKAIEENNDLNEEEKKTKKEEVLQRFVTAKQELEEKLNSAIETAVKEIASEKKLEVIFYKHSVRYGGVDITQEVIEKLK